VNPRLLVVFGPLKDSAFALPNGEMPIGRDSSNWLAISDPSLSRRHCVLQRAGDRVVIRDLKSRNGTLVNGVAVTEAELRHGDQISIGDSVFVLLLKEETEEAAAGGVEFEDSPGQATAQLRPQEALYLQPERILRELPETSQVARNLNALLKLGRLVHCIRDLDELQTQILSLIFEALPAERGAILLDEHVKERFASVFAMDRGGRMKQPLRISRTIARQVLEQGLAILGADVPASNGLAGVDSLVNSQVRSLLCVPLMLLQKVTGCIYLDTTRPADRFDQDHLQLVTAMAGPAAIALDNARRWQWLEQENLRLTTEMQLDHNLVGESAPMKEVYQLLARVAPKDSTVLIQGESGTGKELAARAIHRNSPRAGKPFVAINCGAIPEGLVESELFGHERGAFTGAHAQKKGRLEVADGGVVFLDEVGDLLPAVQVKLLRVLQEREFERVGGNRSIPVDIRLIAASNRNLEQAVKAGEFRSDLYYRLNVVTLEMPPLREHREDIASLAEYFVTKCSAKMKVRPRKIATETMTCLMNYDWPGNVRELEHAMESALVLSTSESIQPEDLPEAIIEKGLSRGDEGSKYHREIKERKKQLIVRAMEEAKGNYTEAARILGVHANYLHRLIRNLELKETLRSMQSRG